VLETSSLVTSSSVVYSDVVVKGTAVHSYAEMCTDWGSFYSNMVVNSISKQLVKLTMVSSQSLNTTVPNNVSSCSDTDPLLTLQTATVNGTTMLVHCGSQTWSSGTCSTNFAMCVNCSSSSSSQSVPYANVFNPCTASSSTSSVDCLQSSLGGVSNKRVSFARVLIATFAVVVPTIESVVVKSVAKLSVVVRITLSQYGAAYCAAYLTTSTPTASQQIVSQANYGWTVSDAVNVTISSLIPATTYYVYCVALSAQGYLSDISVAISNRQLLKTRCCRTVSLGLTTKSVYADTVTAKVATLILTTLPSTTLTVSMSAVHANGTANYTANILFPTTLSMTASSATTTSVAFVGVVHSGIYNISVVIGGSAGSDYEVQYTNGFALQVLNRLATPPTPSLSLAQFSSDGSTISLAFDSSTNKGQVTSPNSFQCSLLFTFTGASAAVCRWSVDATTVTVTPSSTYPLSVGALVTVVANKIRAACPSSYNISTCSKWSAVSSSKQMSVVAPSSPTLPTVQMTSPLSIGSCDSLAIGFGSSTGSGGRAWSSVNISLISTKATNISSLKARLNTLSVAGTAGLLTTPQLTIAGGLLSKGYLFTFGLSLCNFLGACGSSTASVSVLDQVMPIVSIVGGPTFTVTANSSLTVSSTARTVSCDGSQSVLNLQYSWSVYLLNGSSLVAVSVVSKSKDPSKFTIGAYELTPQYSYYVQVMVTNTASLKSSSTSAVVTVPISSLIVVITGGTQQSIRVTESFSVDASGSYDSDQANKGKVGISFAWDCYRMSPSYSESCPLNLGQTNSSLLSGITNVSSANSSSVLGLSMFDSTRTASGQVTLHVLLQGASLVTVITTLSSAVSTTGTLVLQGAVATASSQSSGSVVFQCDWTVDDSSIELSSVSLVPTKQLISSSSSSVYLSLVPNALPDGSTLTFTLTCVATATATGATISTSYATVEVHTNAGPTLGANSVSPTSGYELSTIFQMAANYWVDADTPLSYEFGFVAPSSGTAFVVQSKGLNSVAFALLASGSSSLNYSLTTTFTVYDSLGSSVVQYVSVRVLPTPNETNINATTFGSLAQVFGSVDGMKEVISIVASSLTAVNCTLAPNCTALHRQDCMSTAQTCGGCLSSDYVGVTGDSNEICVLVADYVAASIVGADCDSDADCSSWSRCDLSTATCIDTPKSCTANCTSLDNGKCIFLQLDSLQEVASCAVLDATCAATCICASGYYGDDCSFDEVLLATNQDTTTQLLDSLSQVSDLVTLDAQSAVFWANALQVLSASSDYLSYPSAIVAYNMSMTMLQSSAAVSSTSVTNTLAAVVSNVMGVSLSSSSARRLRRMLSEGTSSNSSVGVDLLLDALSYAVTSQMVPGQTAQTSVQSNYRFSGNIVTAQTVSSSDSNVTVSVPQTALESVSNSTATSLTLSNFGVLLDSESTGFGVGVLSVRGHLADVSSYVNTSKYNVTLTSNALRLNLNGLLDANSTCGESTVLFSFVHFSSESFGIVGNSSVDSNGTSTTKRTTECTAGENRTVLVSCPFGQSVSVYCNGSLPSHTVTTYCPLLRRLPICAVSSASGAQAQCEMVNYTATMTTCRCSSCLFSSSDTYMDMSSRRLDSSSSSTTYSSEVLALSEYSFVQYVSVMESASSFGTVASIRDTLLIAVTFAVIWIGTIVLIFSLEWARSNTERNLSRKVADAKMPLRARTSSNANLNSVVPQPLPTAIASAKASESSKRRASRLTAITLQSLKYSTLEDCLKDYISQLFSPAFSEDSETVRFMREIWNKHEYFSVLQKETGAEQWIAVFCLLTNLNANFFLLAMFYDIQFPNNDGSCAAYETEADCLSETSMFNPSQLKCAWKLTTDAVSQSSSYTCEWQNPQFAIATALVVFVIVLAVSSPITFMISCLCERILMAPAVSEVEQKEANDRARRQTAVLMMNNDNTQANLEALVARSQKQQALSGKRASDSQRPSIFSEILELDGSVRKVCAVAHRLVSKESAKQFKRDDNAADNHSREEKRKRDKDTSKHKSFFALLKELRRYARSLDVDRRAQMRVLLRANKPASSAGPRATIGKELTKTLESNLKIMEEFRLFWGPFLDLPEDQSDHESDADNYESGKDSTGGNSDERDSGQDSGDSGSRRSRSDDDHRNRPESDVDGAAGADEDNYSNRGSDDQESDIESHSPRTRKRASRRHRNNHNRSGGRSKGKKDNAIKKTQTKRRGRRSHDNDSDDDDNYCNTDNNQENDLDTVNAMSAASTELTKVVTEAASWIKKLKNRSPEQVGVQILELFVRDCMGQHSKQAIIFSQKVNPLKQMYVLTWSIKCFTFLCLCILNVYFVFACMLYGKDKGLQWQRGWLFTCIVNVFVDVFINAVTVAAVMHFFVPNLIVDRARNIKRVVSGIVHDLCSTTANNPDGTDASQESANAFSAASYFFVSSHVARAFPELMESRIVLAYKSFFLSKDQMMVINPAMFKPNHPGSVSKHQRRTRTNSQFIDGTRYSMATTFVASASLWVTTLLLLFGSQSLLGQEFIINTFNPGLVTAIAYLGLAVWNNSYFGLLVAVAIVVVALSGVYWLVHKALQRRSHIRAMMLRAQHQIVARAGKSLRGAAVSGSPDSLQRTKKLLSVALDDMDFDRDGDEGTARLTGRTTGRTTGRSTGRATTTGAGAGAGAGAAAAAITDVSQSANNNDFDSSDDNSRKPAASDSGRAGHNSLAERMLGDWENQDGNSNGGGGIDDGEGDGDGAFEFSDDGEMGNDEFLEELLVEEAFNDFLGITDDKDGDDRFMKEAVLPLQYISDDEDDIL
jgi:hypothetical protein